MKVFLRRFLTFVLSLFGRHFSRLFIKIPKIDVSAKIIVTKDRLFCKKIPEFSTLLQYDNIKPIQIIDAGHQQDVHIQYCDIKNFTNARIALVAHFDPQRIVDPYVIYYATHLKSRGYSLILCSANEVILDNDTPNIFEAVLYRKNEGYDFSSWKAAFTALPSLFEANEILFTNDSVFGPIGDINNLFIATKPIKCDFWGVAESLTPRPYLHSYFIVLFKNAIKHEAFRTFLSSISDSGVRLDAIHYEAVLTQWLISHNLTGAARIPASILNKDAIEPAFYYVTELLQTGQYPFIKRRMLFKNPFTILLKGLQPLLEQYEYPTKFILDYAKRLKLKPVIPL
ncbi:MAG: rhamnan synthesis F family protein [Deltaproteobacteria bacterium]|jgi:lipopolysaccharide biosynthesis protein|nr:rhamnan synthesis F family protein [Deltaproteobacteria bacterium]